MEVPVIFEPLLLVETPDVVAFRVLSHVDVEHWNAPMGRVRDLVGEGAPHVRSEHHQGVLAQSARGFIFRVRQFLHQLIKK